MCCRYPIFIDLIQKDDFCNFFAVNAAILYFGEKIGGKIRQFKDLCHISLTRPILAKLCESICFI